MLRGPSYAQVLRAIGQDLEASKLRYFDLKREGRAKRIDPSRTPDFSSLSQILRVIGQYIDRKDGYLLEVSKKAPSLGARVLSVRYQTTTGNPTKERFSASGVLALCVRMYKRRGH